MEQVPPSPARTAPPKRPWSAPRIVSTQAAFEHAILTCNGIVGRTSAARSPKGSCVSGGTAAS